VNICKDIRVIVVVVDMFTLALSTGMLCGVKNTNETFQFILRHPMCWCSKTTSAQATDIFPYLRNLQWVIH